MSETIKTFKYFEEKDLIDADFRSTHLTTRYIGKEIPNLVALTNAFVGNEGELSLYFKDKLTGMITMTKASGVLFNLPLGRKNKYFVLTCAHAFKRPDVIKYFYETPCHAFYKHKERIDVNNNQNESSIKTYLSRYSMYGNFMEKNKRDFYNDIAVASLPSSCNPEFYATLCNVNEASIGSRICVSGYVREDNTRVCLIDGFIDNIIINKKEVIISYLIKANAMNTTPSSGSALFLQKEDKTWAVVGIHVFSVKDKNINIAVGLTDSKFEWLYQFRNEKNTFFQKIKNKFEN